MLNLNDLSIFVAAAECASFSAAARRLGLSQPAVSQTIEKLEREFASRLFLRQGRKVHLSESGLALLPLARELLAGALRLEEAMASLHGELLGEMVLGCATAAGKFLLPGLIAGFRRQYPRVRIHMRVAAQEQVFEGLRAGTLAIGVSGQPGEPGAFESQLIYDDELILIVPPGHPWARHSAIAPADLLHETLLLPAAEQDGARPAWLDGLRRHNLAPELLAPGLGSGDAEATVLAVEAGLGVAFVSRLAAARSLQLGCVAPVRVAGFELAQPVYLARSRRLPQTRTQAAFWDYVTGQQPEVLAAERLLERQLP